MSDMRAFSREELIQIENDIINEISSLSQYTIEEATSIWGGAPYYILTLHKIQHGATIKEIAQFILKELDNQ